MALADIGDVSYVSLNSDDEDYLYSGTISTVTANTIVVVDYNSGEILFFSKDGEPKSRFNRRGRGPGEYTDIINVVYDEATDELFVLDRINKIHVYSSAGVHKREILLSDEVLPSMIMSFDNHSLFFYDLINTRTRAMKDEKDLLPEDYISRFYRISKTDGAVLGHVDLQLPPIFVGIESNGMRILGLPVHATRSAEGVFLCNQEVDTIFLYRHDLELIPVMHKIPSVDSSNPMVHMNNCIDTGDYLFVEVVTVQRGEPYAGIFPKEYYGMDKRTGEIFRPRIVLPDYEGKELIIATTNIRKNHENGYLFELDLFELKQAEKENKLTGKLKELVATLDENIDNNVFVVCDF